MECFLVVAVSMNGLVVSRNFSSYRDIPEEKIELVMAMEAGRKRASSAVLVSSDGDYRSAYGYDCGKGWISKGLSEEDVF